MARGELSVALLGDTHGHLDERILALAHECDRVVHTGDVGDPAILDALALDGEPPVTVLGNNDTPRHWSNQGLDRLAALPQEARLALPGGELVVVHGHRLRARDRHARLRRAYPGATAVVHGHSHRVALDQDDLPWILNPGAAGRTRTYGGPACMILRASASGWRVEIERFPPVQRRR